MKLIRIKTLHFHPLAHSSRIHQIIKPQICFFLARVRWGMLKLFEQGMAMMSEGWMVWLIRDW